MRSTFRTKAATRCPRPIRVSNPQGALSEIENPNPNPAAVALGSNNWYTQDGYGGFDKAGSDYFGGGTYSDCSDPAQPGVRAVLAYIRSLRVASRCEPGHYYLLNNYNPGYEPTLSNEDASTFDGTWQDAYYQDYALGDGATAFTMPPNRNGDGKDPSKTNSIGDTLNNAGISWKYYGDQLNVFHTDPHRPTAPPKASCRTSTADLQPVPVRPVDHGKSGREQAHPGHHEPVRGHRRRYRPAGGFVRRSRAAWWTATRHPRSWTCSKAS